MNSDPDTLNNVLPSYSDFSDPDDDSGSDVLSFDEYDMFGLVDNPDDIVFTRPNLPQVSSFDNIISPNLDPNSDAQASVDDVTFPESESDDEAETSLAGVIKTCPTSTDGSEASSIRLFDDLINDIKSICINYENASIMAKALRDVQSSNLVKSIGSNQSTVPQEANYGTTISE